MELVFKTRKLAKNCSSQKLMIKEYGADRAKFLKMRLISLMSAIDLSIVATLPRLNFHPLLGNRRGQYAVNVLSNWRLILEIAEDPLPLKKDASVDYSLVRKIRILGIEDYHGR